MSIDRLQRMVLLFMAVSLVPVALSYGLAPEISMAWLFGIDASDVNTRHIFRAITGFYFTLVALWAFGAFRPSLRLPALWSMFVFTFGLALGRLASLVIDGWPSPLLFVYMLMEFAMAGISWILIHKHADEQVGQPRQGDGPR